METDQAFVEYVVKAMVDHPEDVSTDRTVDEMGVLITLKVNQQDLGQIIGRQGQTAKSLRTLLRVVGAEDKAVPAFPDQVKAIQQSAAALTYRRALDNINTIEDMRWQVAQNLSVPMVMERGFIRLTASLPGCRNKSGHDSLDPLNAQ